MPSDKLMVAVEIILGTLAVCLLLTLAGCDSMQNEIEDRGIPVIDVSIPI